MKRIYIGKPIITKELNLVPFRVYEGDKVEEIVKKYPALSRILIETKDFPKMKNEKVRIETYFREFEKQVKEESYGRGI